MSEGRYDVACPSPRDPVVRSDRLQGADHATDPVVGERLDREDLLQVRGIGHAPEELEGGKRLE